VIQAKKFEVVNDEGKVVAAFGANMIGDGAVVTKNSKGETTWRP
jgi:hypothetical protein